MTDAERFRALLSQACLGQRGFARRAEIPVRQVNRWAAGKEEIPALVWLAAEHLASCPAAQAEREERLGWTHEQLAAQD